MASDTANPPQADDLSGKRVAVVGKLAGMSRKEVYAALREANATAVDRLDDRVDIVVFGEEELSVIGDQHAFADDLQEKAARGELQFISETTLWQWLGLIEPQQKLHRLYTPAMLADLLGVPKAIIRRWHRRGLIIPARQVRSLPYFDYQEVANAKQLAAMLASGMSPDRIERKLSEISQYLPNVQRPLVQLSVMIEGRDILLRQGEGLVEPGGQMRFDFDRDDTFNPLLSDDSALATPESATEWDARAADFEDDENLDEAIRCLRMALQVGGPSAERSFRLAELLYRAGHLAGAIERYHTAIELNPDLIEARANLGCVLAESGQLVEAVAALEEAISYYDDYCDAHYHLARILDDLGRQREAQPHWEKCLQLNPDSPWADEAYARLHPESA